MYRIGGLFLVFLAGCASGPLVLRCNDKNPTPYSHERPTVPFHIALADSRGTDSWTSDGAPTVLTVHNPTDLFLEVHVQCWPSVSSTHIDFAHHEVTYCMKPHTEKVRLVEFMNVDATTQVCGVDRYTQTTPELCIGHEE